MLKLGEALSQKGLTMWKRTTREKYWEMLEVLPPATQDAHGFLLGEPQDHDFCQVSGYVMPRYDAYLQRRGKYYVSTRPLSLFEYRKYAPLFFAKPIRRRKKRATP